MRNTSGQNLSDIITLAIDFLFEPRKSWRFLIPSCTAAFLGYLLEYTELLNRIDIPKTSGSLPAVFLGIIIPLGLITSYVYIRFQEQERDIFFWIDRKDVENAKKLLDKNPGLLTVARNDGILPLHLAACNGDIKMVELFLTRGVRVDALDNEGQTPLMWAIDDENLEMLKFLIDRGARVDHRDRSNLTMLHISAGGGDLEVVRFLLSRDAPINLQDNEGETPLHAAADMPYVPEILSLLIDGGADINVRDNRGATPLHHVVSSKMYGHHEDLIDSTVKLLLSNGADPLITDMNGKTPADLAGALGRTSILEILNQSEPAKTPD